jgi:hypothetical protein
MPPATKPLHDEPHIDVIRARIAMAAILTQPDRRNWAMGEGPMPSDRLDADCLLTYTLLFILISIHERFLYENYDLNTKSNAVMLLKASQLKRQIAEWLMGHFDNEIIKLEQVVAGFDTIDQQQKLNAATAGEVRQRSNGLRREIETLENEMLSSLNDTHAYNTFNAAIAAKQAELDIYTKKFAELCAAASMKPPEKPRFNDDLPILAMPATPTVKTTMHPHALGFEAHQAQTATLWQRPNWPDAEPVKQEFKRNSTFGNMDGPSGHIPWTIVPKKPKIENGEKKSIINRFKALAFTPVARKMLPGYPTTNWMEVVEDPMLCLGLYFAGLAHGAAHSTTVQPRYTTGRKPSWATIKIPSSSSCMRIAPGENKNFYVPICPDWTLPAEYKHVFLLDHMYPDDVDEWTRNGGKLLTEQDCMPFIEPYMVHARAICDEIVLKGQAATRGAAAWNFIRFHANTKDSPVKREKMLTLLGKPLPSEAPASRDSDADGVLQAAETDILRTLEESSDEEDPIIKGGEVVG